MTYFSADGIHFTCSYTENNWKLLHGAIREVRTEKICTVDELPEYLLDTRNQWSQYINAFYAFILSTYHMLPREITQYIVSLGLPQQY